MEEGDWGRGGSFKRGRDDSSLKGSGRIHRGVKWSRAFRNEVVFMREENITSDATAIESLLGGKS